MFQTRIYNTFNGVDLAYIYIWYSIKHKVTYVGMTNSYSGTIGRANGHFKRNGTLRKRFIESKGYTINSVDDFILFSFPLPPEKKYISVERSYREAIEHLVQKELIKNRLGATYSYDVVSWIRSSRRLGNYQVKKIALSISTKFLDEIKKL